MSIAEERAFRHLAKLLGKTETELYDDLSNTARQALNAAGPQARSAAFEYAGRNFIVSVSYFRVPIKVDLVEGQSRQTLIFIS